MPVVRARALIAATLLLCACDASGGAADAVSEASEAAPLSKRGDGDIGFANRMVMARYAAEHRANPKLPPETAMGEWRVEAALLPSTTASGAGFATRFEPQPGWIGSRVSFAAEQVRFVPARAGLLAASGPLGAPIHPRCTRPEFDADLSDSAGELTDEVDVYQHFGLPAPLRGRYYALICHGGTYARDADGHRSETTEEDAGGPFSLYVYDADRIILQWGAMEFLLRRAVAPTAKSG